MITLAKGQYLSDVMNEIPSDCILSKRIPGYGATTLELNADRNSIIIVPNVPVIISKCSKYPNLLGVYEGVKQDQVIEYIASSTVYKIMTTPESFCKVKYACEKLGVNIYTDFFLLMDECHQLITDVDYRIDIVMPMNDFFMFARKALVSATPINFSDPRFEENLFYTIDIEADYDYKQDIVVTHTYNIPKAVGEYLEIHNGTICFFVNSVVEIYSLMKHFNILEDSAVYCAPKSRSKLKAEYSFTNAYEEWCPNTMRRYNFFTGRFFSAFDLDLDYKPDLVMITDPYTAEHTILDIDTDCIQICGRFRNGINSVTHIYRTDKNIVIKSKDQIEWEISAHEFAYNTINTLYNNADSQVHRFAFDSALQTLPFRKFQYQDFGKNWFAIDNEINAVVTKSKYQSYTHIMKCYTNCHFFNPNFTFCTYNENDDKLNIVRAARSVKDKRKKIVRLLADIKEPFSEYALGFKNEIRKIDPFIVNAYEVLGKEKIEKLKYNQKKLNEEMILVERKGNKVIQLIKNKFSVGKDYQNKTIVNEITKIFEKLNIHPEKEIKPNIIRDYFQVVPFKHNDKRGYRIVSELI